MSQEIIYTSSPRGLRPGSRGFCTVASTSGMPKTLAERLESLSGYRHLYQPIDPNAHLNPIALSHLIMLVGGQKYHVLSRVADAGLDYSQRSNKLAHHVALLTPELTAPGPAWSLSQPGLMETTWSGEPRILPAGRSLPSGGLEPRVCRAWEQCKGDAGWAGIVAEAILKTPQRRVFLVFRPGMDLLPLLAEAEALLPSAARWQFTFSTYYASLPADADCRCRGVLADTPDALSAKRQPGALIIDLCAGNEPAPQTAAAEAARVGVALEVTASPRVEQRTPAETAPLVSDGPRESAVKSVRVAAVGPLPRVSRPPELAPPPVPPPRRFGFSAPRTDLHEEPSWTRFLVSASLFALFGAVMFGLGYFLGLGRSNPPLDQTAQVSDSLGGASGSSTETSSNSRPPGDQHLEHPPKEQKEEQHATPKETTRAAAPNEGGTPGPNPQVAKPADQPEPHQDAQESAKEAAGQGASGPTSGSSTPPSSQPSAEDKPSKPEKKKAAASPDAPQDKTPPAKPPGTAPQAEIRNPFDGLDAWWQPKSPNEGALHSTTDWVVTTFKQRLDPEKLVMDLFPFRQGVSSLGIERGSDQPVWTVSQDGQSPKEIAEFSLRTDEGDTSLLKFRWRGDQNEKSVELLSNYALVLKMAHAKFAHAIRLSRPDPAKPVTLRETQQYQGPFVQFDRLELRDVKLPLSGQYQRGVDKSGCTWKFELHPKPPTYWIVELDHGSDRVDNCKVSARLEYMGRKMERQKVYPELDGLRVALPPPPLPSPERSEDQPIRPADTLMKDLEKGRENQPITYSMYGILDANGIQVAIPLVVSQ